eukprot:TRINITY_DN216_c0_g1_i6.p1 TRINITY_DN216_c0_g1~~TRINITY_DN216_c0_g1_i6.p1  ORF type:complete len:108 (+),score=6.01 TRINITY_DN216_c0_g1_i6:74-397(+)
MGDIPFFLMGDLNARTGNDNFHEIDVVDLSSEFMFDGSETFTECKRVSKDHIINAFGKYLLNVCDQSDLCILNGTTIDRTCGNFTYVSSTGSSVIDYFILSKFYHLP